MKYALLVSLVALSACGYTNPEPPTIRDVGQVVVVNGHTLSRGLTFVNSGDRGTGPIQSLVGQWDSVGRFHPIAIASDRGTWQTFTEGGAAGIAIGAGEAAGYGLLGALAKPAKTVISNVGNPSNSSSSSARTNSKATGGASNNTLTSSLSNTNRNRSTSTQHLNVDASAGASTGAVTVTGTPNTPPVTQPPVNVDPHVGINQ